MGVLKTWWTSALLLALLAGPFFAAGLRSHAGEAGMAAAEPQEAALPASYFRELADLEYRYKRYTAALERYREALAKSPAEAEQTKCRMGIAYVLEAQGEKDEATAAWRNLTSDVNPIVAGRARLTLAERLVEAEQADAAIRALEDLALHERTLVVRQAAVGKLVGLLGSQNRAAARLPAYQEWLRRDPTDRVLLQLVLALHQDNPGGRLAALEAVCQAAPGDAALADLRGEALIQAGRLDEAADVYERLGEAVPGEAPRANERLALIAVKRGHLAEAEELVLRGMGEGPFDVRTTLNLARRFLSLGLWAAAERQGRLAHDSAEGEAMQAAIAMELGEALFRQREFEEARALLLPIAEQDLWQGLRQRARTLVAQLPRVAVEGF